MNAFERLNLYVSLAEDSALDPTKYIWYVYKGRQSIPLRASKSGATVILSRGDLFGLARTNKKSKNVSLYIPRASLMKAISVSSKVFSGIAANSRASNVKRAINQVSMFTKSYNMALKKHEMTRGKKAKQVKEPVAEQDKAAPVIVKDDKNVETVVKTIRKMAINRLKKPFTKIKPGNVVAIPDTVVDANARRAGVGIVMKRMEYKKADVKDATRFKDPLGVDLDTNTDNVFVSTKKVRYMQKRVSFSVQSLINGRVYTIDIADTGNDHNSLLWVRRATDEDYQKLNDFAKIGIGG